MNYNQTKSKYAQQKVDVLSKTTAKLLFGLIVALLLSNAIDSIHASATKQKVETVSYYVYSSDDDWGDWESYDEALRVASECRCLIDKKSFDSNGSLIKSETLNQK